MNALTKFLLLGALCAAAPGRAEESASGETAPKPVFRDAATHGDLARTYEKAKGDDPLVREFGQDPALRDSQAFPPPVSLLEKSDLLVHGGRMTLVPKGAVVFVPDSLQDRLALDEAATFVSWREFYRLNSHWLVPMNVSVEQALGEKPLPSGLLDRLVKSKRIVVATCFEQPISMLSAPVASVGETDPKAP